MTHITPVVTAENTFSLHATKWFRLQRRKEGAPGRLWLGRCNCSFIKRRDAYIAAACAFRYFVRYTGLLYMPCYFGKAARHGRVQRKKGQKQARRPTATRPPPPQSPARRFGSQTWWICCTQTHGPSPYHPAPLHTNSFYYSIPLHLISLSKGSRITSHRQPPIIHHTQWPGSRQNRGSKRSLVCLEIPRASTQRYSEMLPSVSNNFASFPTSLHILLTSSSTAQANKTLIEQLPVFCSKTLSISVQDPRQTRTMPEQWPMSRIQS